MAATFKPRNKGPPKTMAPTADHHQTTPRLNPNNPLSKTS
jgi:hypothetical protein